MRFLTSVNKHPALLKTLLLVFLISMLTSFNSAGAETEGVEYPNKLGLFLGITQESSELDGSLGLEYEYQFSRLLGVGGILEVTGGELERSWILAVPAYIHPYAEWLIILAPGFEFGGSEENFIFRAGVGYEFELRPHWSLVPEFNIDFVGGGDVTLVYGVAVVYSF